MNTLAREPLALIVAMTKDRGIGAGGKMPWHVPEDLKHFRALTEGHAIIMGRKTFASIGRPLPKRTNIVVTCGDAIFPEGVRVARSVDEAIDIARATGDACPFVIGGGAIYADALARATDLHVTTIPDARVTDADVTPIDTWFPAIDPSAFDVVSERRGELEGLIFAHWKRRDALQPRGAS